MGTRKGRCGACASWPIELRRVRFESASYSKAVQGVETWWIAREASRRTWGVQELARGVWLEAEGSKLAQNWPGVPRASRGQPN